MADVRIPNEIETWMQSLGWGEHHDEYHAVKRWDIWYYLAAQGNQDAKDVVEYIEAKGWKRAKNQEGAKGDGLEFLAMHRAMILLLLKKFPQHAEIFKGWQTPPTDPSDLNDPVADGTEFDPEKKEGIRLIENEPKFFESEDHFGVFVETNIQATADNPNNRRADKRYGNHNYLHNRWTDNTSPVNLGDPKVNIFNARFWKLHGWIDNIWTKYRKNVGLSDEDPKYKELIEYYTHMMSGHHHMMIAKEVNMERPKLLKNIFML